MTMRNEIPCWACYEQPVSDDHVTLCCPDGTERTVYAFDKQDVHMVYDDEGFETVVKDGAPYKVIRFFPDRCGTYVIKGRSFEQVLTATGSRDRGYVTVSARDPRYLSYADNTPFFPVGINLAFPTAIPKSDGHEFGTSFQNGFLGLRQYARWFKACAENGVNMARVWLGHEYFCVDTETAGECDLVQFAKIDALIALAKTYGIKLKLTLEQFRFFDYSKQATSNSYSDDVFRKFNKRLYHNGEPCPSIHEWLTADVWKDLWLKKVEELARRISGNTTVLAIELWNEMNALDDEAVLAWNETMLPHVKRLFPHHLIVNSLGSYDSAWATDWYDRFCWDRSDIKQMHRYLDRGAPFSVCHDALIDLLTDGVSTLKDAKQPLLVAETGAVNNCHSGPFTYYCCDHTGLLFCDAVYTPVFLGACGTGNIWHWDERYVESKNLYHYFQPIAALCAGVDFLREGFESAVYQTDTAVLLLLKGTHTALGYVRNKSHNWQRVLRDGQEAAPVLEYSVAVGDYTACEVVDIWDGETAHAHVADGTLTVRDMKYGLLIKLFR